MCIEFVQVEDESPMSNSVELLHPSASHPQLLVLVIWILIFVQFLRFKCGISDAITSLLLKILKTMFIVLEALILVKFVIALVAPFLVRFIY